MALSTDKLIIAQLHSDPGTSAQDSFYLYDIVSSQATPCQVRIGNDSGIQETDLVTFRVRGNLSLRVVYYGDNGE